MSRSPKSAPPPGGQPQAASAPSPSDVALLSALGLLQTGKTDGESPAGGASQVGDADSYERVAELYARAARGHSPSARALVNASDIVLDLALVSDPVADETGSRGPSGAGSASSSVTGRATLRERILGDAAVVVATAVSAGPKEGRKLASPLEVVTQLHIDDEGDVERRRVIESLGAAGGVGRERQDQAIRELLERLAPFMDFEVVLVSAVRGSETVHRVHHGFPKELGNVDIIPRSASFCTHCVSADAPLLVHDAAAEAFFRQGLMVRHMGARSYLGIPIRATSKSGDRVPLGALCCIGSRPREIVSAEVTFLELFATEAEQIVNGGVVTEAVVTEAVRRGDAYEEAWFRRILDAQLAREREGGPSSGAVLFSVGDLTSSLQEAWASFLSEEKPLVGSLAEGRCLVLVAGRRVAAAGGAARFAESLRARLGATEKPVALAFSSAGVFDSAADWIAATADA